MLWQKYIKLGIYISYTKSIPSIINYYRSLTLGLGGIDILRYRNVLGWGK